MECLQPEQLDYLLNYARNNTIKMSNHMFGCRIIQRIIEKVKISDSELIISEIIKNAAELAQNQFGNYVVQHVLEYGNFEQKQKMIIQLKDKLVYLSKQKFSSNVIEKCFQHTTGTTQEMLLYAMVGQQWDP